MRTNRDPKMNSRREHTLDAGVESFGCRVLGEPEDSAGERIEPRRPGLL